MLKFSLLVATILIGVVTYYSAFDVEYNGYTIKKPAESFRFNVREYNLFDHIK